MKPSTQSLASDRLRQGFNLAAVLAAFGINVWANIAPINGLTIGDISKQFFSDVLITPANYAFAIWGVIYLGLIAFGIYQALPSKRQDPHLQRLGYLLVLASFAQIIWIFLFQYRLFTLSLVAMLGILLPLIGAYLRVGIGSRRVSREEQWFVHIPLSIYLGWISVATIVNVALTLYNLDWSGWGISAPIWSAIALLAAALIAAVVSLQRSDLAFLLVIVWALVAIAVRQAEQPLIWVTAGGLAIALVVLLLLERLRRRQSRLAR